MALETKTSLKEQEKEIYLGLLHFFLESQDENASFSMERLAESKPIVYSKMGQYSHMTGDFRSYLISIANKLETGSDINLGRFIRSSIDGLVASDFEYNPRLVLELSSSENNSRPKNTDNKKRDGSTNFDLPPITFPPRRPTLPLLECYARLQKVGFDPRTMNGDEMYLKIDTIDPDVASSLLRHSRTLSEALEGYVPPN